MTARIIMTERDKLVNQVVTELWKDRYNHERWIIELIYEEVDTWSLHDIKEKLHSLSEKAKTEVK